MIKLTYIFGNLYPLQILDHFFQHEPQDFTLSQLARATGNRSRTAARTAIKFYKDLGLIKVSRIELKQVFYRLNPESEQYQIIKDIIIRQRNE